MKKEKVVVNVTIFLMCIVLTCVMSMQFKTARQTNLTDIKNMNEDELKSEIVVWQKKLLLLLRINIKIPNKKS